MDGERWERPDDNDDDDDDPLNLFACIDFSLKHVRHPCSDFPTISEAFIRNIFSPLKKKNQ